MDRAAPGPIGGVRDLFARPRSRRCILRGLGGGAAALLVGASHRRAGGQSGLETGVAGPGGIAWQGAGRIDQAGASFTAYGYLTHVAGLDEPRLYLTNGVPLARTEAEARFTFFGTATLLSRSEVENLILVDADGDLSFYFNEVGGARFDRPESFFSGDEIAQLAGRFASTLDVQAPNSGIATGYAEFTQAAATPFAIDGEEARFGRTGLRTRLQFTGQGTRTEALLPRSTIVFSGVGIVAGEAAAATPQAAAAEVWDLVPRERLPAEVRRETAAERGTLTLTLPASLGGGSVSTTVTSGEGGVIGEVAADGEDLLFTFTEITYDVAPIDLPLGITLVPARITLDPGQPSTLRARRASGEIVRDFHWLLSAEGVTFDGEAAIAFGDTAQSEVVEATALDDDHVAIRLRTHWQSEIPLTRLAVGADLVEIGPLAAAADFDGTYIIAFS